MPTLKDVARLACVDVSTVSRALNNTSYVHPDTKKRIYAAAKELGYHPNALAQALRQGRRHTIGVVVPRLHLAIFSELLQGIEEKARQLGYATLISNTEDNPQTEKECLDRLRNGFVDGIIIAGTGYNNIDLAAAKEKGITVCNIPAYSTIVADYEACGSDAVHFLYQKGCRKIGFINGSLELAPYKGRHNGYCRAVKKLSLCENLSQSDYPVNSFEHGYECANQLLDDVPGLDAVLAAIDIQGLGAIRAVTERGLRIPDEVKVMSLTGHAVGGMLQTSMTSMEMPANEMGMRAAQMLIDTIHAPSGEKPSVQHLTFATVLAEREST